MCSLQDRDSVSRALSEAGINPMPDKIQALKHWPTPNCLTDVRAFLGLASYYRKFYEASPLLQNH